MVPNKNLKLFTNPISPPGRSVELTAKALNLTLEIVPVDLLGNETLTPEYQNRNPQHTVPMIEDDGKFIWDSQAIIVYLATVYSKSGEDLYPRDPYQRAKVNAGLHFNSGVLFSRLKMVIAPVLRGLRKEFNDEHLEYFNTGLQLLEDTLQKDFYVGNKITLADLSCVSTVSSFDAILPVQQERYPKIFDWLRRMEKLPYYQEANGKGIQMMSQILSKNLNNT